MHALHILQCCTCLLMFTSMCIHKGQGCREGGFRKPPGKSLYWASQELLYSYQLPVLYNYQTACNMHTYSQHVMATHIWLAIGFRAQFSLIYIRRWALFRIMKIIMNKMCDKLSKTIHLDGFAVQRKELWVASLWAVAEASIWTVGASLLCQVSKMPKGIARSKWPRHLWQRIAWQPM